MVEVKIKKSLPHAYPLFRYFTPDIAVQFSQSNFNKFSWLLVKLLHRLTMLKFQLPLLVLIYVYQRGKEELFELLIVKFRNLGVKNLQEQVMLHIIWTKFCSS